jgi:hypothetical protein
MIMHKCTSQECYVYNLIVQNCEVIPKEKLWANEKVVNKMEIKLGYVLRCPSCLSIVIFFPIDYSNLRSRVQVCCILLITC